MIAMRTIDLNADLGEGGPDDAELIAQVTSANIACGGHAGDEQTMRTAIDACLLAGVAIGAHPGYADRMHFGRRPMFLPLAQVKALVASQLEGSLEIAERAGAHVHHVKPHGALYHQADHDPQLAEAVAAATAEILPGCIFYAPPGGMMAAAASHAGLKVRAEGFMDRRYTESGTLIPRSEPGAVITEMPLAVAQALQIACEQRVQTAQGTWLSLAAETLCVHGDSPHAVAILREVRTALVAAGCRLSSSI